MLLRLCLYSSLFLSLSVCVCVSLCLCLSTFLSVCLSMLKDWRLKVTQIRQPDQNINNSQQKIALLAAMKEHLSPEVVAFRRTTIASAADRLQLFAGHQVHLTRRRCIRNIVYGSSSRPDLHHRISNHRSWYVGPECQERCRETSHWNAFKVLRLRAVDVIDCVAFGRCSRILRRNSKQNLMNLDIWKLLVFYSSQTNAIEQQIFLEMLPYGSHSTPRVGLLNWLADVLNIDDQHNFEAFLCTVLWSNKIHWFIIKTTDEDLYLGELI